MPARTKKRATPAASQPAPTDQIAVVDLRYEPSALAHGMDVDRVHSILRSAESGDVRDLMCLYRDIVVSDAHLQCEFAKRKLAVLGDSMSFQPYDRNDQASIAATEAIKDMVSHCKAWRVTCAHLLDAVLYPVSLVEKVFAPTSTPGRAFDVHTLVPVPHHLLDYTQGVMRIYDVDPASGAILSTTRLPDHSRYIIHRGHLLSTPDNWGGPMRSILFWWLLSTMDREWWSRYMDRYGSPFMVGTYASGDKDSRSVLERAFALSVKLGGLVVSENTKVEIKEAATASTGEAYERFLTICQREKSKLILGQTLSADAQPTGLGAGTANQHEAVRQDIRQFDAIMLADTLRDQLFDQYLTVNGISADPPTITFGSTSTSEVSSIIDMLKAIAATDVELTDAALATVSERSGLQLQRRTAPRGPTPFSAHRAIAPHPQR
jgi:phage gp29-like protein